MFSLQVQLANPENGKEGYNKVGAIKAWRNATGHSLQESKLFFDQIDFGGVAVAKLSFQPREHDLAILKQDLLAAGVLLSFPDDNEKKSMVDSWKVSLATASKLQNWDLVIDLATLLKKYSGIY
jgi:hypothetical protein